ncbi:hypothetical protein [Dyadobacter sp. NIV53]|uniref:hypothetical protein n=1 Tax=Dyadobacter sp. NIV53 TaxID=2861765 RepID=UPI001C88B309|nr:hypothetical protein [Dyadobacter sp. NIV53]
MDSNSKKRILLLITNIYATMNVIHSGLIKPLAGQYEVYIISDLIYQEEIEEISQHFNIKLHKIGIPLPNESGLIRILRLLEKAIFFRFYKIGTQKIKEKQKGFWYHFVIGSILNAIEILGLSELLLSILRKLIIRFTSNKSALKGLGSYNFCGVISTSPLDIRENSIVNFLKKKIFLHWQ